MKLELTDCIPTTIMEDLLQFIYLGEVCVHKENVRPLIAASDFLQMSNLKDLVCRFYEKKLCAANCLSISSLADEFNCETLKKSADSFVYQHFADVSHSDEFKALNVDQVLHLIKSDNVNVKKEERVFEAVIGWIEFDLEHRSRCILKLLQSVRLPLLDKYYLFDKIANNPLIMQDDDCKELIIEAINFQTLKDRRSLNSSLQTTPRLSLDVTRIVIACGGVQDELSTKEALCYVPEVDFWYPLAPLHHERNNFGISVCDEKIYAVGGDVEGRPLKSVEFYDFGLDRWTEVASLPAPTAGHGTAVFNGEIYAVGCGIGESSSDSVLKYVDSSNKWVAVRNLKVPRRGACVVSHLHLYAIGGYGPNGMALASVERYDPYIDEWAKIFPMNSSRAYASGAVIGNKIYVIGGEYAMWSFYCSGEVFDITSDEWHSIADAFIPRSFTGIADINGEIYVFGGMKSSNSGSGDDDDFVDASECCDVEIYNPVSNSWKKGCPLPIATSGIKCVSFYTSKHAVEVRCGIHFPRSDNVNSKVSCSLKQR